MILENPLILRKEENKVRKPINDSSKICTEGIN